LESAKFVWLDALQLAAAPEAREEELLRSRQLFQHASTIKEGWGWGVNNGDIHLALASVNLCLWASSWADADASADAGDPAAAVALRRELLDEAEEAVALCQSRDGSQGPAAEWLREVSMFMDTIRAARSDPDGESAALSALDDDMVGDLSVGAGVWQERTAMYAAAVAAAVAPRQPQVSPPPAGSWPDRGSPECVQNERLNA